jgi:hypothetical protein
MGAAVTGVVESESLVVVIALTIMIAMRTFSSGAMRDAYDSHAQDAKSAKAKTN